MLIVAEAFGAIAVVLNFIGYRQNRVERYLFISAFALLSLSVHFFMLDAMAAGVGTCLAGLRNFIAIKNRSRWVLFIFVAANILFLLYEWFILHHDWNVLLAETLGLMYALSVGSIFGTIFNISNLFSIVTKMASDRKKTRL